MKWRAKRGWEALEPAPWSLNEVEVACSWHISVPDVSSPSHHSPTMRLECLITLVAALTICSFAAQTGDQRPVECHPYSKSPAFGLTVGYLMWGRP